MSNRRLYCVECESDQLAMVKVTSVPYQLFISPEDLLYLGFPLNLENGNVKGSNFTKYDVLCLDCGHILWEVADPAAIEDALKDGGMIIERKKVC